MVGKSLFLAKMKFLICISLIFFVILVQYIVVPEFFLDIFLNLPLILVLIFAIFLNYYNAILFSFLIGIISDFFSAGAFGINIISFVIIAFIIEAIISRLRNFNAVAVFLVGFLAMLTYNFLFFLINYFFKFFDLNYYHFSASIFLGKEFLLSILINTCLFVLFYFIYKMFNK